MLSYEESQCGEPPQLITPLRTSRASPANQMSSWLPSVSRVALISRGRPLRVQMVTGGFARPHSTTAQAAATAPVPQAKVSASTPRSYVRINHSADEPPAETKFTFAPSGPRVASERSIRAHSGTAGAHRLDVLVGPVRGRSVTAVHHDEVVSRPRHLVDRKAR